MYTIVTARPWGQAFVEDENTILISLDKLSSDYTFFANRKMKTEQGKWSKHDPAIIRSNGDLVIIYQHREDVTETITIYDNTAASGTKIGTATVFAATNPCLTYDVNFTTGLTVVTATASSDLTVSYY